MVVSQLPVPKGRFRVSFSYDVRPGQKAHYYYSIPEITPQRRVEMYEHLHKMMKMPGFKLNPLYG